MDILIEEKDGGLWVAALKNGRLEGLEIDPITEEVRWGSIYRARVMSVSKTLDAVYLDLDGDNGGILYNKDVRIRREDGSYEKGGAKAIGKLFQPGDLVTVQAKSAYSPRKEDSFIPSENKIVQVSMDITIPGRYLIYCPFMQENQLSSRIRNKKLRKQLTQMMDNMGDVSGCILRSAASSVQTEFLVRESEILMETWGHVELYVDDEEIGLIMLGPDAIQRTLSDQAMHTIDGIELTTMGHYQLVEEWCHVYAPDLMTKIEPIELKDAEFDLALFYHRDLMSKITALLNPYVMLPRGGSIIIQETAALIAVDVNKSGDKRGNLAVNIDAAREVARQMRLRNLGGMVIVDFLRSQNKTDEQKFMDALHEAVALDPCTVQIHGRTSLGLLEMTRKRRTPPLRERLADELEGL